MRVSTAEKREKDALKTSINQSEILRPTLTIHSLLELNKKAKKKSSSMPLRRGKWTQEEEDYANRLIKEFKAGLLPLDDGTTLRNFLSKVSL